MHVFVKSFFKIFLEIMDLLKNFEKQKTKFLMHDREAVLKKAYGTKESSI